MSPQSPRSLRRRAPLTPTRMERVAVVALADRLRDALARVAEAGVVELDEPVSKNGGETGEAAQRLQRMTTHTESPALAATTPDLDTLERAGRADLLAGEAQLQKFAEGAVLRRELAALAGWCAADDLPDLATRLSDTGAAAVPMPKPRSMDPPTLLSTRDGIGSAFATLVRTYGTVPYRDIDPSPWAGLTYVVMFGMMFGDVGHGMLLVAGAVMVRLGWIRRFPSLKRMWTFIAAAGISAAVFGALYGEFFGPTGVVPVLWLAPLENPLRLLLVALALGAVLLGVAYTIGAVNRWREGGVRLALYSPSGIAGALVFTGIGVVVAGATVAPKLWVTIGAVIALTGLGLALVGLYAESGGGAAGVLQAAIGGFDLVMRIGSNLMSFTRLAAFGMTHAALGWVVWRGTTALWGHGWVATVGAVALFVVGNVIAFTLEALVAGVQALRLEYYELFSRVFVGEGRPFRPWRLPVIEMEAAC